MERQAGNPNVSFLLADFLEAEQICSLARSFTQRYSRLAVLINNAGGSFMERRVTARMSGTISPSDHCGALSRIRTPGTQANSLPEESLYHYDPIVACPHR